MEVARAERRVPERMKEVAAMETMHRTMPANANPAYVAAFGMPSCMRGQAAIFGGAGHSSALKQVDVPRTWLADIRLALAPDSAPWGSPA
jgi:hypothetical protein